MNALFILIPALLMIVIVVAAGAWNAYQQVHVPSQSSQTQRSPQPVTATGFVIAMLILMVIAILAPLVWIIIAFSFSPYAL